MRGYQLTDRHKDRILNVLVVLSLGLFIIGVVNHTTPRKTNLPANTEYSLSRINRLSQANIHTYAPLEPIQQSVFPSGSTKSTFSVPSTQAGLSMNEAPINRSSVQFEVSTPLTQQLPLKNVVNGVTGAVDSLF